MKPMVPGVYQDRGALWTRNADPGKRVYNERLVQRKGSEYRSWNAGRSKMAALLRKAPDTPWFDGRQDILYLGAASGTTVSHMHDILEGGRVFAVEFSPRSMRDLVWSLEGRDGVIPILADARAPARYAPWMDRPVGALVQDVAQRDQVDIFVRNLPFLAPDGLGYLFLKARSIHVAKAPSAIYNEVAAGLRQAGLQILKQVDLDPFERDHRAFVVRRGRA